MKKFLMLLFFTLTIPTYLFSARLQTRRSPVHKKAVAAAIASNFIIAGCGLVLGAYFDYDAAKTGAAASIIATTSITPRVLEWVKGNVINRVEQRIITYTGIFVGAWSITAALIHQTPIAFI